MNVVIRPLQVRRKRLFLDCSMGCPSSSCRGLSTPMSAGVLSRCMLIPMMLVVDVSAAAARISMFLLICEVCLAIVLMCVIVPQSSSGAICPSLPQA